MNKQMLKFLSNFIDTNNPKRELNYAIIDFEKLTITATDTRKLVEINIPNEDTTNCKGIFYIHKKIVKVMEQLALRDNEYFFKDNCLILDDVKISLDNEYKTHDQIKENKGFKHPDTEGIIKSVNDNIFNTSCVTQLDYELARNDAFVVSSFFNPLIELCRIPNYEVSYNKQDMTEETDNSSKVKVIGNDNHRVIFTAVYMGKQFVPEENNQSVMNFK